MKCPHCGKEVFGKGHNVEQFYDEPEVLTPEEEIQRLQAEVEAGKRLWMDAQSRCKQQALRGDKLQAENKAMNAVLDEIHDGTTEGYVIEMIDVLRGKAVWGEDGVADYSQNKTGGE